MNGDRQWSGRTDGALWMHKALIGLFKVLPMSVVYLFMAFVVPFYMVINRQGYLSIYHYLRLRHGWNPVRAFFGCYANHFLFGAGMLDRFAAYAGRRFKTEIPEYHIFTDLAGADEGFMVLSSHIGNSEICGYFLNSDRKQMNVLSFPGEKAYVRDWRNKKLSENNIRLISESDEMARLFALNSALASGEIVSMYADRNFGSPRTVKVEMLGAGAQIPAVPFSIAVMRDIPVVAVFSLKKGLKSYFVRLVRLDTPEMSAMGKEARIQALADAYSKAVDEILRQWPLQWFNFYEFWDE